MMRTPFRSPPLAACLAPLSAAVLALTLSACHTTPPRSAQLDQARQTFQAASASPDVAGGAPLELERARKALFQAETAWADRHDEKETAHLAYLATQQTQVAVNVGMQHAADNMVTAAGSERDKVQIQASAQEAQQAKASAQSANASAQAANARANELEQELKELAGKQTNRGLVVVLQDVLFDVGQADLKSGAQARIDRLASVLKNHPERQVHIEGFTDSTGSDELNQGLSERRAQAVKDALTGKGVEASRIDTHGYGKERPVASNKTAAGRQQNRRVEVVFSDAKGTFASP